MVYELADATWGKTFSCVLLHSELLGEEEDDQNNDGDDGFQAVCLTKPVESKD